MHWNDAGVDPKTIPDAVIRSERARRNSGWRKAPSGGRVWGHHIEGYSRCRCAACIMERKEKKASKALKT